jgi:hypothetical protein
VLRQRPARRLARCGCAAGRGRALFGGPQGAGGIGLGDARLQFGERQFQLLEPGTALRRGAEPLPAQPGDLQLQPLDLQIEQPLRLFRRRRLSLGGEPCRALRRGSSRASARSAGSGWGAVITPGLNQNQARL